MKLKKIILISLICLLGSTLLVSFDKKTEKTIQLTMWSFNDELQIPIQYFHQINPNINIELIIIRPQDYYSKLASVKKTGKDIPDIITCDETWLKDFIDSGYFDNLEKFPYYCDASSLVPYTVEIGRNTKTGAISALSWQVCPGGFFYRRSIAKKVFGTDDPAIIGLKVNNMEKFIETGRELKKKGYYLYPGIGDLFNSVIALRSKPWVVDGQLILEDVMVDYYDTAKIIYDEGLDAQIGQSSPKWFDSMKMDSNVFGQLLPSWGFHLIMKPNAPDSSGDWAVCDPPGNFYDGGTWISIHKRSKNKEAAWKFVKMMCLDPDFGEWLAIETGESLSNMVVVNKIKQTFSDHYLGGQNHYEYFAKAAKKVDGSLSTSYDIMINNLFLNSVLLYLYGDKSKTFVIENFKAKVSTTYPELIVE